MRAGSAAQARTATLVAVGPPDRLAEAAHALDAADAAGSLRCVLISTDEGAPLPFEERDGMAAVEGVRAAHLDNAIAALRLSSLPTVIWWRGGPPESLHAVASLADRVVLDAVDAAPLWRRAPPLFERTAITDLRWARLTRWRALMARLFDLAEVRAAIPMFERLSLSGTDADECALFGGWLDSALRWNGRVAIEVSDAPADAPFAGARLEGGSVDLELRLLPNGACIACEARLRHTVLASRVVSAGEQSLAAVLSEDLRVRSRDLAFERALDSTLVLQEQRR